MTEHQWLQHGSADRILVVEDDESVGELLTMLLEGEGYQVTLVRTACAALDAMQCTTCQRAAMRRAPDAPPPALVLLDLLLPGMSGEDLIQRLATYDTVPPIIVLSAKRDDALQAAATMQGVRCVLAKPFMVDELLDQIRTVLTSTVA
jgi:DNA-binding response OmpR family regulator